MSERNPWTVLSTSVPFENRWIRVTAHDVLTPKGTQGHYGVVRFKTVAVGVLPVFDDGTTMIVGQFRFALDAYSWEIVEGGGTLDRPPLESAAVELAEETGLHAGRWHELIRLHLSNSVTDERAVAFAAWELEQGSATPEDTEELALRRLPLRALHDMVMDGSITDSITVATVLRLETVFRRGALPTGLAERVARGFG